MEFVKGDLATTLQLEDEFVGVSRSPLAATPMNAGVLVPTPSMGAPGANSSM